MLRRLAPKASLLLVIVALIAACGQPQQPDGPDKPKPPPPPDGYAHSSVAAGWEHNLLLKEDGTVMAWGRNNYGQLGDGTKDDSLHSLVEVPGLSDVISVHTRGSSSFALREDGTIWAWGFNSGYLGIGTTETEQLTPTQVVGLSDVVQMDVGDEHVLAVTSEGTVWAWGNNQFYKLGDGTNENRSSPVQVVGPSGIVRVLASARQHSLAMESDGTLWMWGRSVGVIPDYDPAIPARIPGLPGIVDVVGGGYAVSNVDWIFVLALDEDGELWNWSINSGTSQLPTKMTSFGSPVAIGTNPYGTFLTLLDDATVWAWGSNSWGALGNGDESPTYQADPAQIASLTDIVSIHAGVDHTLAMDENGDLWAWGRNNFGQLGDGTTETRYVPVAVTMLEDAP